MAGTMTVGWARVCSAVIGLVAGLGWVNTPTTAAGPPESLYHWRPVRLGAGGFVTGFVSHPLDASVRYCRTDVGNAYRWDGRAREWRPMVVREAGQGMPAETAAAPAGCGVDSIAVDPQDPRVLLLTMSASRPDMMKAQAPAIASNLYASIDGGVSFKAHPLPVTMEPNGPWRTEGERLKVDPQNAAVVYYGSVKDGLWRSTDQGATWTRVEGGGAPNAKANVLSVHMVAGKGLVNRDGRKCSRLVFAVGAKGSVLQSKDGGATWKNISAGTDLDGKCKISTLDPKGTLCVIADGMRDLWDWSVDDPKWRRTRVELDWQKTPHAVAFDPKNPLRMYALSDGAGLARSLDGGKSWTPLGPSLAFANIFGWLPQPPGWRSNAGITIDADGAVWIPQGNEGMITCKPTDKEDAAHPPRWTIDSKGIEEFVTHDVILPPNHGDAVFAVEDATGLVSSDLSRFVARQIPLQDQLISNGTGLAYCPNAPEFLAVVSADVHHTGTGKSYSGYSPDGGKTWKPFAGLPVDPASGKPLSPAGSIAISSRGSWSTGADHLVWLPTGDGPTYYSHDGGETWKPSAGFPLKNGYWIFALKQRSLVADPFTPDTFYFVGTWGGGFYVSTDGGKSWKPQPNAGLPRFNHHANLAADRSVKGALWFCDGWDGASEHGLWRSTTGGARFHKLDGVEFALTLCLGAGSGRTGDARSAVYFYGKMVDSPEWGVFRSTDDGGSWTRVSYYPSGIFDQPTCMAASWDEFARVVVGFSGNSFVVGTETKPTP